MGRRVTGVSLVELAIVIAVTGLIALPLGRVVTEHVKNSLVTDQAVAAVNLARYEQERIVPLAYDATLNWCSANRAQLPPSESWCPVTVTGANPYASLDYYVTRQVVGQTPTDGSATTTMQRIVVKVFRKGDTSPMATVTTFRAQGVAYSP